MRMDRYKDFEEQEELKEEEKDIVLSRSQKNQDMYKDVYMNTTMVDLNKLFDDEKKEELVTNETLYHEEPYEEKSYDVNDYLKKAHESHPMDNIKRDLNSNEFLEQEDEIKKLIADIDENDDFFSDLRGDNEDTLIGGKLKTDEFDSYIYNSLLEDEFDLKMGNKALENALGEETVINLQNIEDEKLEHTFEKILESDKKTRNKIKKLPIIIFSITLLMLIIVILIIIFK